MTKHNMPVSTGTSKKLFILTLCLLIFSFLIQIVVSNNSAIKGNELTKLYKHKEILEKEISRLEYEKSTINSLSYVESKARTLGFVDMTEPLHALKSPTVAVANSL